MNPTEGDKVFVVHGRNIAARDAMYAFLRSTGLSPITWEDAVAITGKPSPTTLEIVRAGIVASKCTVVLMTGDDRAQLRPEYGQEALLPQPRPNVIFEAGWALAIAGQEKTILVRFGGLREFSDINGINMITLDNSQKKRSALLERLKLASLNIDRNNDIYLNPELSGDFDQPIECDISPDTVLQRGDFTEVLVDSSLSHSASSLELEKEIAAYLRGSLSPNLKYNYLGAQGAQNWLDLTKDPSYGHDHMTHVLGQNMSHIATQLKMYCPRLDFVSLGPGDGSLDAQLLHALQSKMMVTHYYPIDLSVELLQKAVSNIVSRPTLIDNNGQKLRIKAIHGDFYQLARYKPIYAYDSAPNLISLIGYTLGNHDESELIKRIREGMENGDFLLVDARLIDQNIDTSQSLSDGQKEDIKNNYSHAVNNRFAFGPVEALTLADFADTEFHHEVSSRTTSVPGALNIVTYIEQLNTSFRRKRERFQCRRLELAVTTVYHENQLIGWFERKGFTLLWKNADNKTLFLLLRKE